MSVKKHNSEIERAVKEIPGLIYDEIHKKHTTSKTPVYVSPHNSKIWMITGVILFSLCIIVLWGVNVASVLYETNNTDNDNSIHLITDSKKEFQNILNNFGEQSASQKEILAENISTSTSTLATSTIETLLNTIFSHSTTTLTSTTQQQQQQQ